MPTIINEFEALADNAAPPSAGTQAQAEPEDSKPKIDVAELHRQLRLLHERELRVWAH